MKSISEHVNGGAHVVEAVERQIEHLEAVGSQGLYVLFEGGVATDEDQIRVHLEDRLERVERLRDCMGALEVRMSRGDWNQILEAAQGERLP